MFLIRAAFWLAVVILLLPADPPASETTTAPVDAFEAIDAARDTVADVSSFCDRNPDTCVTGSAVFDLIARKVSYGARKVGEYFASHDEAVSQEHTGTLKRDDLTSPWQPPRRPDRS